MTNLEKRGTRSVLCDVADGYVTSMGVGSYLAGLDGLVGIIEKESR